MIEVDCYRGKTVAVFGLARSGVSAALALAAGGAEVVGWDDKAPARAAAEAAGVRVRSLDDIDWRDIAALVLSPGVPLTHPAPHAFVVKALEARTEVIGDVELFFRVMRGLNAETRPRVVCITGTNGKSTTTALVGHMLRGLGHDAEVGGNIGKPVLDLAPPSARRVYVLELSSFQIDLTPSLRPDVGVLLNITPDHLDRHGTMENYARVKANIFARLGRGDHAIVGVDDAHCAQICTQLSSRGDVAVSPVSVGKVLGRGIHVVDGVLHDASGTTSRPVIDLKTIAHLPGVHNWQNLAAAYAAVKPFVRDPGEIARVMPSFPGLAHRIESVGTLGAVRFVNDSKATNADAAARALACFSDIHWIAGGKAKEGGIESLSSFYPRIRRAYLIGAAMDSFAATLDGRVDCQRSVRLEAAMRQAYLDAREAGGGVVLLSPACASFDQFRDFEARGDEFKRIFSMIAAEVNQQGE